MTMTLIEMDGFLRGKCLPGDMKVNETNAEYLLRKMNELQQKLTESERYGRAADITIENLETRLKAAECNDTDARCHVAELERKVEQLAAENAALKELIEQHAGSVAVCPNCSHEEPSETDDIVALYRTMETPATDAILAEVRASGVEMFAASLKVVGGNEHPYSAVANEFAAQLRQEAK